MPFPSDDYCSEEEAETPDPIPSKPSFAGCSTRSTERTTMQPESPNAEFRWPCCAKAHPFTATFMTTAGQTAARRSRVRCNRRNYPGPSNDRTGQRKTYLLHALPHSHRRSRYAASQAHGLRYAVRGSAAIGLARHVATGRIDGCWNFAPSLGIARRLSHLRGGRATFGFVREACFPDDLIQSLRHPFPSGSGSKIFMEETSRALGLET